MANIRDRMLPRKASRVTSRQSGWVWPITGKYRRYNTTPELAKIQSHFGCVRGFCQANSATADDLTPRYRRSLFRILALFQLLDLSPLTFDLTLLRGYLALQLVICFFVVLHFMPDDTARHCASPPPIRASCSGRWTAAPTIAPAPAPSTPPPSKPFSVVVKDCPRH